MTRRTALTLLLVLSLTAGCDSGASSDTVPCPCRGGGCDFGITLTAGDDTAQHYGFSGIERDCQPGRDGKVESALWDGVGVCIGDRDCLVTVDPGDRMLLVIDPMYPAMTVERLLWDYPHPDLPVDSTPVGDGQWEITAPGEPDEYALMIEIVSPGSSGWYGVDVIVEEP